MPAAVFIFYFYFFVFCSCEISNIECLIVLRSNEIWIKSMSIEHWTWSIFLIFMQCYRCCCCCCCFYFQVMCLQRDIISTPSTVKKNNNMPSMHDIRGRWNRNVRFKFFPEHYFAVHFRTICRILMLNACVHQLRPSKCHFHIKTVMSDSNDVYQQLKYWNATSE